MRQFRGWIIAAAVLFVLLIGLLIARPHYYLFTRVNADEIGLKVRGGQIVSVVGPGMYSDFGLFVSMEKYTTQSYQFSVEDGEVITSDNQRLGVKVSGSMFRPGLEVGEESILGYWVKYRSVYTNNDALQAVANDISTQAMKVCVGNRPFNDSVLGSDRDALGECISEELNKRASQYGLKVANVTVPNVALSQEVQALLDQITTSRLQTEKAAQDKLKAEAEGLAKQAEQEAAIRVEQSRIQEEAKQKTILAKLTQEQLVAQKQVIEAQKANDLLSAQRDLEINKAQAEAAIEKAKADLAQEIALAALYTQNPSYFQYQMALANASALKPTDKLIFVPEGTIPNLVFGNGVTPVVPVPGNSTAIPQ